MKTLKLCFIGFGNVGQKVSALLLEKQDWLRETFATDVIVTGIGEAPEDLEEEAYEEALPEEP